MGKPNTPGCGSGAGCCTVDCVLATDDFGDGSLASYTQLVGTWTESGGVVEPDTSTANQRLRFDTVTLTTLYAHLVRVRVRGAAGDRAGVILYGDGNNYVQAVVTFGGGTSGELELVKVAAGATEFTHTAELECAVNEYDLPANGWVTLTLRFQDAFCVDAILNVVAEVDDTSETHTLGRATAGSLPASLKIGLIAGSPSAAVEFDDLSLELGSTRPSGSCEHIVHCCVSDEADQTGHGSEGWTIVSGSWTDDAANDRTSVGTVLAKRLIDYTWLNDNLHALVDLGPINYVVTDPDDLLDETVFRYFFSANDTNDWWVEVRYTPIGDGTIGAFTHRFYGVFITLENEGTIKAWIYLEVGVGPIGTSAAGYDRLEVAVWDCSVVFGLDTFPGPVWWSADGGTEAEGALAWAQNFRLCVDGNALNRVGKVGIGTGSPVDEAGFANLLVACSAPQDCANYPDSDPPTPDDPEDPTGCCDGYDSLQTGDPIELTLSSWAYWLGPGCVDPDCVDSNFLTDFNAAHTLTVIEKNANRIRAIGYLPENSCDDCDGFVVDAGRGIKVRLHFRAELVIESVSETECVAKLWVRGRCASCVWYFESAGFTKGADCTTVDLVLQSGNASPGGYDCCLQAGDATFALP